MNIYTAQTTQARARELLDYDAPTGLLTWRKPSRRGQKPGDLAGTVTHAGALAIGFDRKVHPGHFIAWVHVKGVPPAGMQVRHLNGDKLDNRIENLHLVQTGLMAVEEILKTEDDLRLRLKWPSGNLVLPSLALVRALTDYHPENGTFTWRVSRAAEFPIGAALKPRIGTDGYGRVCLLNMEYRVSRLAWLHHHGVDPGDMQVDHINRDRLDNRISNLRLATNRQNAANAKLRESNRWGCKGVYGSEGKWKVQFRVGRKKHQIGTIYSTLEAAVSAARKAYRELHGEFGHA